MLDEIKKILYVEDDQDIAEVCIMTLEDIGNFEVKHCSSGYDAVDVLDSFSPQLVLLDVMMPSMDGITTLEKIREKEGGKYIPVIFMTAKAQVHEQEKYIKLGAIGVIVKPFDPMIICDTIKDLWEKFNG